MIDAIQLEQALDRVYAALLAADFSELPKIVTETEGLLAGFDALPDRAMAERLRRKAQRNGQCLQAAARGLRSAQRRLVETSGGTALHATYTSRGQRSDVGTSPGNLTKRL